MSTAKVAAYLLAARAAYLLEEEVEVEEVVESAAWQRHG
jgi:hypothetical protein